MKKLLIFLTVNISFYLHAQTEMKLVNTEVAKACEDDMYLLQLFCLGQVPHNKNREKVKILINHGYAVGYSEELRNPLWVCYKATRFEGEVKPVTHERSNFFAADMRTDAKVHGQTFRGGYQRGHMAPDNAISSIYGTLAQQETYLMSNICPQKKNLNAIGNAWQKLEHYILKLAKEREHIFVFCGPIFSEEDRDDPVNAKITRGGPKRKIAIPEAFYMILVDVKEEYKLSLEGDLFLPKVSVISYIFPQETPRGADFKDREKYGASIDEVEKRTGFDFFPGVEAKFEETWKKIEKEKVTAHW